MQKGKPKRKVKKPQTQPRPGIELKMDPQPIFYYPGEQGSNKLRDQKVLITGGDSGIGKAVAILFAREGADVAISYLNEHADAKETKRLIEELFGRTCILIPGDIGKEAQCKSVVKKTVKEFGKIDVLVNNAAIHYEHKTLEELPTRELLKTFQTNIFSFFWITKEALPHMEEGSSIINSSSVVAYRGSAALMDYSATKGAIVAFTRSLAANLKERKIRVNGVAPGPIWTPLVVSSFPAKKVASHGSDSPMGRPGEPAEIAYSYLFLASKDSSYMTGQFLHPNGGEIVNG